MSPDSPEKRAQEPEEFVESFVDQEDETAEYFVDHFFLFLTDSQEIAFLSEQWEELFLRFWEVPLTSLDEEQLASFFDHLPQGFTLGANAPVRASVKEKSFYAVVKSSVHEYISDEKEIYTNMERRLDPTFSLPETFPPEVYETYFAGVVRELRRHFVDSSPR